MRQQRFIADLNFYHSLSVAAIGHAGDSRRQHIQYAGGGRRLNGDTDVTSVNLYP